MAEALAEAGADIVGVSASLEPNGSEIEKAVTALGRTPRPRPDRVVEVLWRQIAAAVEIDP